MISSIQKFFNSKKILVFGTVSLSLLFLMNNTRIFSFVCEFLEQKHQKNIRRFRPLRIILVRHGESEANIDDKVYISTPDNKIVLTQKGEEQALSIGKKLKDLVKDEKIVFYVSPFKRTLQTFQQIQKSFKKDQYMFYEDPRIREQERGNLERFALDPEKVEEVEADRNKVGSFFYRFKTGESGADVNDRVGQFLTSIYRKFNSTDFYWRRENNNIIIVTHGMTIRCFIKRFFKLTVEEFEQLKNPKNCQVVIIQRNSEDNYNYELLKENLFPDVK